MGDYQPPSFSSFSDQATNHTASGGGDYVEADSRVIDEEFESGPGAAAESPPWSNEEDPQSAFAPGQWVLSRDERRRIALDANRHGQDPGQAVRAVEYAMRARRMMPRHRITPDLANFLTSLSGLLH